MSTNGQLRGIGANLSATSWASAVGDWAVGNHSTRHLMCRHCASPPFCCADFLSSIAISAITQSFRHVPVAQRSYALVIMYRYVLHYSWIPLIKITCSGDDRRRYRCCHLANSTKHMRGLVWYLLYAFYRVSAVYDIWPLSVHLSVCLSQVSILSKWLNI